MADEAVAGGRRRALLPFVGGDSPVAMARDARLLHERSTLALSVVNQRQLIPRAPGLRRGRPGTLFRVAKWVVSAGLALRRGGTRAGYAASVVYVLVGLLVRYAWVGAGKLSARDDENVAEMARLRRHGQ